MNILVVGPHPDDQELGMGGTIAQAQRSGAQRTAAGHDQRRADAARRSGRLAPRKRAADILGVKRVCSICPTAFSTHSIEVRHMVAGVIREHQAEIVFLPYFEDAHPDHIATTRIVEDARFDAKLTKTNLPGEPIYPKWMFYYYCTHLRWAPIRRSALTSPATSSASAMRSGVSNAVRDSGEKSQGRRVDRRSGTCTSAAASAHSVSRAVLHARTAWLVACDDASAIIGFAKSSPWRARCAYHWTAEVSVYLSSDHIGRGIGRALYTQLFTILKAQGYHSAIGGITLPNPASVRLHESFGMKRVGTFIENGWKNGRWHDVGYWMSVLNDSDSEPSPVRPVREVMAELHSRE
jgi:L-amino acid N-acyltransferase YncA/LmbE family N-acetylglucosaminyl deacetylase